LEWSRQPTLTYSLQDKVTGCEYVSVFDSKLEISLAIGIYLYNRISAYAGIANFGAIRIANGLKAHWRQIQLNERALGAERIHSLVQLAKTWLDQLYAAHSTVHFEKRGACRSPTTLTLSMLHARTRPLLACRSKEKGPLTICS
jgi:hypothetical protein